MDREAMRQAITNEPYNMELSVTIPGPTDTPSLYDRSDVDFSVLPMPASF